MNSSGEDSDDDDPFYKKYIKLEKVAEGTYGIVWRAKNTETGKIVAIKVFKNIGNEGLPVSAVREIHILKKLKSPYVLQPLQLHIKPKAVSMVTEWKQLPLSRLIKPGPPSPHSSTQAIPSPLPVRKIVRQLLQALESVHSNFILHRDLKPANIVLDNLDFLNLKIIDFGMAKERKWNKAIAMTNQVGTLYYRAPQLLGGSMSYTSAIDMWALGCIFYELMTKQIMFKADNQALQLLAIYEDIATEEQANRLIKDHEQILQIKLNNWARIQGVLESKGYGKTKPEVDLLRKLVCIDEKLRIGCKEALDHQYFMVEE